MSQSGGVNEDVFNRELKMNRQTRQKAISRIFLFWGMTLIALAFAGRPASAQVSKVYFQLNGTYNTFVNTAEFEIDKHRFLPEIDAGIGFWIGTEKLWQLNYETGFEMRGFVKEYPFVRSEYNFLTFTNKVLLDYTINPKLRVEGGLGIDFYQSFFKENYFYKEIGGGVRAVDVQIVGGLNYEIIKWLELGVRMRYGFVPMISGQKVKDYGGLSEKKNHINMCAGEILLRFVVFKNQKG